MSPKTTPDPEKKTRGPKSFVGLATPELSARIRQAAEIDGIAEATARETIARHLDATLDLSILCQILETARRERRERAGVHPFEPPPLLPASEGVGVEDGVA